MIRFMLVIRFHFVTSDLAHHSFLVEYSCFLCPFTQATSIQASLQNV